MELSKWFLIILGVLDSGTLQGLIFFGLALSVVLSLLTLNFPDLSIEGTFPLGAAIAAVLLGQHMSPTFVLAVAAIAGACGGLLTATFHVRFGMSKLLSGICTAAILYTANMWIMGNRGNLPVMDAPTFLSWAESADVALKQSLYPTARSFFHLATIALCLALALLMKLGIDFLLSSEFGVALRSVGQSEEGARYHGRNPSHYKLAGLAIANAVAAVSGALASQHQGFADVQMGVGSLVLGLAAVILGQEIFSRLGVSLSSAKAITRAALLGVVVYQIIFAVILRTGAPPTSLKLCAGLSLVVVIAMRHRHKEVRFAW
jgi:putative ABC transport system permease protein